MYSKQKGAEEPVSVSRTETNPRTCLCVSSSDSPRPSIKAAASSWPLYRVYGTSGAKTLSSKSPPGLPPAGRGCGTGNFYNDERGPLGRIDAG
jgi:hypothetical protein